MKKLVRRDRGTGCIRQRKQGLWEGRLSRRSQKPTSVYGKTRKDVQDKLFKLQREPVQSAELEALRVDQWLERWLEDVRLNPKLSLNTYDLYKRTATKHINPHIGAKRLTKLSRTDIWDMLDNLRALGVGDRTRQLVHKVLRRALQMALKRDKVDRNECTLVDRPEAVSKPRAFLKTEEDILRFQRAAEASKFCPLYMTALYTGMRQGEILALTWDCVNLGDGFIDVRSTLTKDESGHLVATKPKSQASVRRIVLPKVLLEVLRSYRKTTMDPSLPQSPWVFHGPTGLALSKFGHLRFDFRRLARRVGYDGLTFHGLRHTHATFLNSKGVNAKAIQERLGWSTTRMLFDVYAHSTKTIQDEAIAALDSVRGTGAESGASDLSGTVSGTA